MPIERRCTKLGEDLDKQIEKNKEKFAEVFADLSRKSTVDKMEDNQKELYMKLDELVER